MTESTVLPAAGAGVREGVSRASDEELIQELGRARTRIRTEIAKRVVGQDAVIDQLLVALFSRGHCLFVGVPG
ncbi:MAG TPA: AAA family ATPase, partial [Myxococcales bacterium]|nr:AAA family ATPase [Myxococcales bacterium]